MTTPVIAEARRLADIMGHVESATELPGRCATALRTMADELERLRAQEVPTVEDINAQRWTGMDGTTAFHLIERHGDDWWHCGRLMEAWRAANSPAAPAQQAGQAPAPAPHTSCQYCDGTGDVHRAGGEWLGECNQCPAAALHAFKNFHRLLCERFGYSHDEKDWRRDQLSLIEFIAAKIASPAVGADVPAGMVLVPRELLTDAAESIDDYRAGVEFGSCDRKLLGRLKAAAAQAPAADGKP